MVFRKKRQNDSQESNAGNGNNSTQNNQNNQANAGAQQPNGTQKPPEEQMQKMLNEQAMALNASFKADVKAHLPAIIMGVILFIFATLIVGYHFVFFF